VTATPGHGAALVRWHAPTAIPGLAVKGYTASATSPGEPAAHCTVTATTCTIKGLGTGHLYHVTVVATNAIGTSRPSVAAPVKVH
jgi:hypothetical protein